MREYHGICVKKDPRATSLFRGKILSVVFSVVLFSIVIRLFSLQVLGYRYYQEKVIDEITAGSALTAPRGNIYDRNMVLLATDVTAWRIYLCPVEIYAASVKEKIDYAKIISEGVSGILGIDAETVYKKASNSSHLDETLTRKADDETKNKILRFAESSGTVTMLRVEATKARYYPGGETLSHVLGFTGSDNSGLFGLESTYNDLLKGKDGQYITARDATGKVLFNGFSGYTEPIAGYSIVTTIDSYVQRELEHQLAEAALNADAKNRVTGIVMNVNTGAILAMATLPNYDPNTPYVLDEASEVLLESYGYAPGSTEYRKEKSNLLYNMWNNKAISELYEPGSTFKIITCAAALETGVVTENSIFHCNGSYKVGGYNISCHKHGGHGTLTFAEGLQQSCNPVMMQVAERIGSDRFYGYFQAFGYLEKTGVDLPSEAVGLFHKQEALGATELATASFGQRFKVSPIAQLAAVATVANGGRSVTPHLFSYAADADGNHVAEYEAPEETQIISEDTAKRIAAILEAGVSGTGGARNAGVLGYSIAAKTGTSEKFDVLNAEGRSYLRVGSCVAFAPADQAEIAVIIIVDEPTSQNKYGSMTAAPYVSAFLGNVLPYLGYSADESEIGTPTTVPSLTGVSKAEAVKTLKSVGLSYEIIGNGNTVIRQTPDHGSSLPKTGGKVILYTDSDSEATVKVPSLIGKTAEEANRLLSDAGLNAVFTGGGITASPTEAAVAAQSPAGGEILKKGSVVTVRILYTGDTD